jgi:N-methylhydantoinase A
MQNDRAPILLAIDVGGTFTDAVVWDGATLRTGKVSSTPEDQGIGVTEAAHRLAPSADLLLHGTTVATNALLERRGAPTALVTTAGFEDVIEIARQDRPSLYDSFVDRPTPLVAPENRHGVARDATTTPIVDESITAVAISLLYGYERGDAEEQIAAGLLAERPDLVIALSSRVAPEFREYERTSTTVLNAYLQPEVQRYLDRIERRLDEAGMNPRLAVMRSSGGLMSPEVAGSMPSAILLSGPAGGVVAAAALGAALGHRSVISFDMGGTSTDVCRIENATPEVTYTRAVDGFPNQMPSVAINTVGAGGGSIAWIDSGGSLRVGAQSAGAEPGPAAYGRGGLLPTVTDANVVLGRISDDLADDLHLDRVAAAAALRSIAGPFDGDIEAAALGIVEVVEEVMAGAIRKVTIEEGADPRDSILVAFGGAGGLHAGSLARRLGMRSAVVPPHAGVFSAVGLLLSPPRIDRARGVLITEATRATITDIVAEVTAEAAADLVAMTGVAGTTTAAIDVRYLGQAHELTIDWRGDWQTLVADFTELHTTRNGFARPGDPIEVVTVRGRATGEPALEWQAAETTPSGRAPSAESVRVVITNEGPMKAGTMPRTAMTIGKPVTGPAIITDPEATTYVGPDETAVLHPSGAVEVTW